jgi:hypothetical protein
MKIQLKIHKSISVVFFFMLLSCIALSVSAQQTNPNNLPPCPKLDYSKTDDLGISGRTGKWTNCWGRYKVELEKDYIGNVLEGEWHHGRLHGHGAAYLQAENQWKGDKYVGGYKDGKKHGKGTYTWSNGNKYVGDWKDGKRHGQGTFSAANGDKYVGEWKDHLPNGKGIETFVDGRKPNSGIFENGKFISYVKID